MYHPAAARLCGSRLAAAAALAACDSPAVRLRTHRAVDVDASRPTGTGFVRDPDRMAAKCPLHPRACVGRVIAALAVVWAVLVVAAPWLATVPAVGGAYLSASAYGFGALVCHQRPERSFHLAGAQLPVCARCTGLYLSAAVGILFVWARRPAPVVPFGRWRTYLLCAALPTAATLMYEWWRPSGVSGGTPCPRGRAAGRRSRRASRRDRRRVSG